MYATLKEVQAAIIDRIDACAEAGVDTRSPEATAWYKADPLSCKLLKLHDIYHNALSHAKTAGYVGVGCISFAEAAIVEHQMDEEVL